MKPSPLVSRASLALALVLAMDVVFAIPRAAISAEGIDGVRTVLSSRAVLPADAWAQLERGKPVAAVVDGTDATEVSAIGAIRLATPVAAFVTRFRAIEQMETGPQVQQIGRFSRIPTAEDVQALTLDLGDFGLLRSCEPGDCRVQLPAAIIEQARSAAAAGPERANSVVRTYLLDLVQGYRQHGAVALGQYNDKDDPLSLAVGFEAVASRPNALPVAQPDLLTFFRQYPQGAAGTFEQFFYWTKIDFGLRPTIRLNHVVMAPLGARVDGLRYMIASRQLWASHYFDSALEVRLLAEDPERPTRGSYLVYSTVVRSRSLGGVLGTMVRGKVRRQARAALETYLIRTRDILGRATPTPPAPSPAPAAPHPMSPASARPVTPAPKPASATPARR